MQTIRALAPSIHPWRARPLARALRRSLGGALVLTSFASTLAAQETFDRAAIEKLKDLGHNQSQVMEITSWLTNVYGGRLTGAPSTLAAGEWTVKKLTEWGLVNAKLEPWGPFGRGWVNERFVAQVTSPYPFTVIGYANNQSNLFRCAALRGKRNDNGVRWEWRFTAHEVGYVDGSRAWARRAHGSASKLARRATPRSW